MPRASASPVGGCMHTVVDCVPDCAKRSGFFTAFREAIGSHTTSYLPCGFAKSGTPEKSLAPPSLSRRRRSQLTLGHVMASPLPLNHQLCQRHYQSTISQCLISSPVLACSRRHIADIQLCQSLGTLREYWHYLINNLPLHDFTTI